MQITQEQLVKMMPHCKNPGAWAKLLSDNLEVAGITTPRQTAYFLAQCGHESGDFNVLVENLNYGAQGLLNTFGKYFGPPPKQNATQCERKPENIANIVYANRMGNGPSESGDGWKFRGRGVLQVTGKSNYTECSKFIFGDDTLLKNPDLLLQPEYALKSAIWYWTKNKLASVQDFSQLTLKINGGTNGQPERVSRLVACQNVIGL